MFQDAIGQEFLDMPYHFQLLDTKKAGPIPASPRTWTIVRFVFNVYKMSRGLAEPVGLHSFELQRMHSLQHLLKHINL